MAKDKDRWGTAIANAVQGFGIVAGTEITFAQLEDIWQIICNEHVTEINTNTEITTTVAVASVTGVTTGAGVSGPGTGSGNLASIS
jgi:hypothetical protein